MKRAGLGVSEGPRGPEKIGDRPHARPRIVIKLLQEAARGSGTTVMAASHDQDVISASESDAGVFDPT